MYEAVEGGEKLSAVGHRYQWPRVRSTGVAEEVGPSQLDLLEGGARYPGRRGLWASSLGLGNGGVVYLHRCGGDSVDLGRRGGERVSAKTLSTPLMYMISLVNSAR